MTVIGVVECGAGLQDDGAWDGLCWKLRLSTGSTRVGSHLGGSLVLVNGACQEHCVGELLGRGSGAR